MWGGGLLPSQTPPSSQHVNLILCSTLPVTHSQPALLRPAPRPGPEPALIPARPRPRRWRSRPKQIDLASSHASATPLALSSSQYLSLADMAAKQQAARPGRAPVPAPDRWRSRLTLPAEAQLTRQWQCHAHAPGPFPIPFPHHHGQAAGCRFFKLPIHRARPAEQQQQLAK